jgi:hypothetical protein
VEESLLNPFDNFFFRLDLHMLKHDLSTGTLEELTKQLEQGIENVKKQSERSEAIASAMQEASAQTGVSKFVDVFSQQAAEHKGATRTWLMVSGFTLLLIVAILGFFIGQFIVALKGETAVSTAIQIFFIKILLVSFLSVVFYQIAKNYNANMHLYVLNKHRENSLKTFRSFVEASEGDRQVQNAILLQATKSIFDAVDTGYIKTGDGNLTAIETVKIIDQMKEK